MRRLKQRIIEWAYTAQPQKRNVIQRHITDHYNRRNEQRAATARAAEKTRDA